MTASRPTVLVAGNGMVGFRFCRELVARAADRYKIVVYGEDDRPAYDRVHLTHILGSRRLEDLALAPKSWYQQSGIELHVGDPIAWVDRHDRRARSLSGREIRYDTLVLATGADPVEPPIHGVDLPGVFLYRNAADVSAIKLHARRANAVAVLGGGLLGLEVAAALAKNGLQTTVVEPARHLMPRQLDPISADIVESDLARRGIHVMTGTRPRAIRHRMGMLVVELDRGEPLPVELVVVAAGIRPRDDLASSAGLAVDEDDGGVLIDDRLVTSDPNILAIGDCARHAGVAYGLVGPGYEMARIAAERLAGRPDATLFTGADRSCRLSVAGIEVAALGDHDAGGRPLVFHDGEVRRTLILRGGAVVGARAVGPWPRIDEIELAIASGRRLLAQESDRFCKTGDPFTARAPDRGGVAGWPDTALACRCARVTCGAVRAEVARGCSSLTALGTATGAGTVCGSCRPALAQLWTGKARPRRVSRGFAAVSALALAAVAAFLMAPPLSLESSGGLFDLLASFWVPGGHKMASGFALAGAAGGALALIGTRRLWRSRRGPLFVGLHALVGVSAMLVLVAHTGLHAGSNLNRALLLAFLGAIATGGALGLSSLVSRRARSPLLWSHLLLLSVLPVLLAFHIVAVFYF
jgi:nitrite reductase (NADH) large subunit